MTGDQPTTAVLTPAHRRHIHLLNQVDGLGMGTRSPDLHVVVAMDDVDLARRRLPITTDRWRTEIPTLRTTPAGLPVAAARNLAARTAIELGAEVLVFLDVDCIPGPRMLQAYVDAVEHGAGSEPALWCGEVKYLGPPPPVGYPVGALDALATANEGRPSLRPGEVLPEPQFERFWSLSFAMSAHDWSASGGFCEDYVGYGAEDTDFGQVVQAAGGSLTWLGGATAYHQHHESHDPPLAHVESVVRNAGIFHDRWGWWPMLGWLHEFERRGLARPDAATGRWMVAA